jgi:hypothetical protein
MTREILGDGEPSAEAAPPKLLPGAIDWTKPVRTKGRRLPVTIYAVDPALKKPVVGKIHDEYAEVTDWHLNGSFHPTKGESGLDLENVPTAPAPALGALDDLKLAFLSGFSAGHSAGVDAASDDIMRHNDSPNAEQAWEEFVAARAEAP